MELFAEPSKLQAVANFPVPQTDQRERIFGFDVVLLQLCNSGRSFNRFDVKSAQIQVQWTEECDRAFNKLNQQLCSAPVLSSPDFSRPLVLQTDASERGVGAVLSQHSDQGEDHPIAYFSKKLLPREERYSTIDKKSALR